MRWVSVLAAGAAMLATAAVAAPGDLLVVTGDVVNVRDGPGTRHGVLRHAVRDQQAVELDRDGDWVRVQIPGEAPGWIHQSLLHAVSRPQPAAAGAAAATPEVALPPAAAAAAAGPPAGAAPTVERTAAPATVVDPLTRFRGQVEELNARAVALAGVELFSGAEAVDERTVKVLVTDAWNLVPEAGQTSYTNALFDRWR
jgi:uncharacterized protein YraI